MAATLCRLTSTMLATHATAIGHASILFVDVIILVIALRLMSRGIRETILRERMLFAVLACTAILGRWAFAAIPNVQPVTILMIMAGSLLGWRKGVGMALLVTIVSNVQLGTGLWTIFQALGWALVAVIGAVFSDKFISDDGHFKIKPILLAGIVTAFAFDWIVSLSLLPTIADLGAFTTYLVAGLPYDILHAFGNITFALWLVPSLNLLLDRSGWQAPEKIASASKANAVV